MAGGRRRDSGKATVRDVATSAQVSTATVSRVLNDGPKVSQEVRARVQAAIEASGYVPHASARALASQRYLRMGAIVPTLCNATFAAGIETLQKRLSEGGYQLAVSSADYDPETEALQARTLLAAGVDGLMLVGTSHPSWLYEMLRRDRIPFVCTYVNKAPEGGGAVGLDNRDAGRRVARFLIDLGHRQIAMIAAPTRGNDRASDRLAGVREELRTRGLDLPASHVVESPYSMSDGRLSMRTLIELQPRPTAVVCGNDSIAFGALTEARANGLAVPRDLSLISFGDLEFASMLEPPLTTLQIPFAEIGRRAAEYLLARLGGRPARTTTVLETSLILRGSTAAPPTDDT